MTAVFIRRIPCKSKQVNTSWNHFVDGL